MQDMQDVTIVGVNPAISHSQLVLFIGFECNIFYFNILIYIYMCILYIYNFVNLYYNIYI
jgi:hypothetical protein